MNQRKDDRAHEIGARLLKDRIVFVGTPIDDHVSSLLIAQMLFLHKENRKQPIHMYVNSPGGAVTAGLAVLDTMDFVACPVYTYCIGSSFGMATLLLAHGARGRRHCLRNSRIGIGPLWGGQMKDGDDAKVQADEISRLKKEFIEIFAKDTGRMPGYLERDLAQDQWMSPEEAKDYGIIDEVVEKAG